LSRARFIVLDLSSRDPVAGSSTLTWMLVSPNNRPLGRGGTSFASSDACRAAVERLRARHSGATSTVAVVEANKQWAWRVELDGTTVAMSTRTYLRQRECSYNLDRFLAAVPAAELDGGVRVVGAGARR
jgi:hypothetical protein